MEQHIPTIQEEHRTMVTTLCKDGQTIIDQLTAEDAHIWHMGTGIIGEAAELAEAVLLHLSGAELNIKNIIEELGDSEFYLYGLCHPLGLTRPVRECKVFDTDHVELSLLSLKTVKISKDIFDWIKRRVIYRKVMDVEKLFDMILEYDKCLAAFRHIAGVTHVDTLDANLEKLTKGDRARYKGGVYSDEAAQDRADKDGSE